MNKVKWNNQKECKQNRILVSEEIVNVFTWKWFFKWQFIDLLPANSISQQVDLGLLLTR